MTTQCRETKLAFHKSASREVVGRFDSGETISAMGGILLREGKQSQSGSGEPTARAHEWKAVCEVV